VNVRLHLKTLPQVTVVPASAVQQGAKGRYVYVVQPDNVVKLTTVATGQEDEKQVVITQGVKPGDKVATAGFSSLKDGTKISLGNGKKPGKADAKPDAEKKQPRTGKRPRNGKGKGDNGKGRNRQNTSGAANAAPAPAVAESKVMPQGHAKPQKQTE
jgi:multidrug efflux system membrane fusion protein